MTSPVSVGQWWGWTWLGRPMRNNITLYWPHEIQWLMTSPVSVGQLRGWSWLGRPMRNNSPLLLTIENQWLMTSPVLVGQWRGWSWLGGPRRNNIPLLLTNENLMTDDVTCFSGPMTRMVLTGATNEKQYTPFIDQWESNDWWRHMFQWANDEDGPDWGDLKHNEKEPEMVLKKVKEVSTKFLPARTFHRRFLPPFRQSMNFFKEKCWIKFLALKRIAVGG